MSSVTPKLAVDKPRDLNRSRKLNIEFLRQGRKATHNKQLDLDLP